MTDDWTKRWSKRVTLCDAGQVLARMDGRDVRWELAAKQAELHRLQKQRDGHLAQHQSGQVDMTTLEIERIQLELKQLEHHEQHLAICSPVDGIVVVGESEKRDGAPLSRGQTLFEVAPLDKMILEIDVPEHDVTFAQSGMKTVVRLDAFPLETQRGSLTRINPRAELRDNTNVFVAEMVVANTNQSLRPGMRGTARIVSGRRPFGWLVFRKPVAKLLAGLGW